MRKGGAFRWISSLRVYKDALREIDTVQAIAAKHGIHPSQVREWRKDDLIKFLHTKSGELTMERVFSRALKR